MIHLPQLSACLARASLDAILITSTPNLQYALGRVVFGGTALVTRTGIWYVTERDDFLSDSPALTVLSCRGKACPEVIAQLVKSLGLCDLGFEEQQLSFAAYQIYAESLSCNLVPAQQVLQLARISKAPDELEKLRAVQRITDQAYLDTLPHIRPGITEHDIAGMLTERMMAAGAFILSFGPIVASGPNGCNPHGAASNRIIQSGDFVTMDFGCIMNGYCSDMTRTVAVGNPTAEMRHVYNTVLAAQLAGIEAAHANITGCEIDSAARKVITAEGYGEYFIHNFGHGIGIEGHESPGAGRLDTTPLPSGAVISAEPGIYIPGKFGVRIEDLIVLTETGCENLNTAPKELLIL